MVVGALATGRTGLAVGLCWVLAAGCSGDDGDAAGPTTAGSVVTTTTVPPRPTTTTSLVYDPATVEGQVEAAYLRSWEVYAAAVYDLVLDEAALASVYAGEALEVFRSEIGRRISQDRYSRFAMDHDIQVNVVGPGVALVLDRQVNHHVLVDSRTRVPIEPDPNTQYTAAVRLEKVDGSWRVVHMDVMR